MEIMTGEIGLYQVDYMGQVSYWEVDPWAEIDSYTYEDNYLTRTQYVTIRILKAWNGDWLLGSGIKLQDKVNIGSLAIGTYEYTWDRVFAKAEELGGDMGAPYMLLSRQNVPNPFYDGSEQCAEVLNRGVINIPQLIGVVTAYKSG